LRFIYIFKTDKIFDFKDKKNTEISKYSLNIKKGIKGMNRDLNMIVIQFHKSYQDTREVFYFIFYKKFSNQKHIIFRYSALILCFTNGKVTISLKRIYRLVSSIFLVIFYFIF
jgi:hypothetical protein